MSKYIVCQESTPLPQEQDSLVKAIISKVDSSLILNPFLYKGNKSLGITSRITTTENNGGRKAFVLDKVQQKRL